MSVATVRLHTSRSVRRFPTFQCAHKVAIARHATASNSSWHYMLLTPQGRCRPSPPCRFDSFKRQVGFPPAALAMRSFEFESVFIRDEIRKGAFRDSF